MPTAADLGTSRESNSHQRSELVPDRCRELRERYRRVRHHTQRIVENLIAEDCVIQSMPDVSPTRWHLAHTTWFFETFVLRHASDYEPIHPEFEHLFNSYYNSVGDPFPRDRRGLLSRPPVAEIHAYRREVDRRMCERLERESTWTPAKLDVVELGLHHEQQHQELMLTDIKHVFGCNPLWPALEDSSIGPADAAPDSVWVDFAEGVRAIGSDGPEFTFDNERPRHRVFAEPFSLRSRLVTNGEFLAFVEDGGYERADLWLAEGWQTVVSQGWRGPLYWSSQAERRSEFTLAGLKEWNRHWPVCHVSYFEADAYARWAGARLPTEAEWEIAAASQAVPPCGAEDRFRAGRAIHPVATSDGGPLHDLVGCCWQWTSSSYAPYPGYQPPQGALGEYNGKFMCNQYVLRGGSCATSHGHTRTTYRNFFPAAARWQFTGIRLAKDSPGR